MTSLFLLPANRLSYLRARLFLLPAILAAVLLPATGWAQVSFTGTTASQNLGSEAIGSMSAAQTLNFSVTAGTTIGSIAVVTEGLPNLDFAGATGTTCAASQYALAAACVVNVTFAPTAAGLRMGAVVFFSAAGSTGAQLGSVPIYGIGTGPQIAFSPATAVAISPTANGIPLNSPRGVAVDAAGDLFIADTYNNRVVEVPAGDGGAIAIDPTVNGSGLSTPYGVALDGAGDLFIADTYNYRIVEVPAGGGVPIAIGLAVGNTGGYMTLPSCVIADAVGDLFILDRNNDRVLEVPAGSGAAVVIDSAVKLVGPFQAALDGAGDLFITDNSGVVEAPAGGGAAITIDPKVNGVALHFPSGLAVDAAGDLFIGDAENNRIVRVPFGGGAATAFDPVVNGLPVGSPYGLAMDGGGDLFIADGGNPQRVVEVEFSAPPAINFATATEVGVTDTRDGTQTVEVLNIGNEPLNFSSLSYPEDFSAASGDANACAGSTSLGAGQQCDLPIEFTPEYVGSPLAEDVTITDNALNVSGVQQSIAVSGTGIAGPTVSLSCTNLSYGGQELGSASASQSVTLTNTSGLVLTISSIAVTGADASSFVFGSTCGSSVAAGASCSIHGHFAPTVAGALSATIIITDNAAGSPQSIALSGTGVTEPTVSLSSTGLSYGNQEVGTASASQSVTFTNTGSSTLTISNFAVTGADASSFAFGSTCGTSVAGGASCIIHGHFAPTVPGALSAAITITDNAGDSPQSIALSGTGVTAPTASLSSTSVSYGNQEVKTAGASQSVTLTNTGGSTLTISSVAVTGADASSFVFGSTCGSSVAAGASCLIHGHFAPLGSGPRSAKVTITDNATSSTQSISLSGTGVSPPTVSLSSTSLSFGNQKVGTASGSQSVTLTNTGSSPLAITSVAVTGADASSFVFGSYCGSSVAAGASCLIHGHFAPTVKGLLTATVTITGNASGSPQSIVLTGTGE
ncbi:MAG: choice-of-anchor D domain-containing protein [Terracidiphilus sp.]|jgi:hypothetical protein